MASPSVDAAKERISMNGEEIVAGPDDVEAIDQSQQDESSATAAQPKPAALARPQTALSPTAAVAEIQRQAEVIGGIVRTAFTQSLLPQDWVDMGGKPYLAGSGAERMLKYLMKFGFSIVDTKMERFEDHDKEGSYYFYVCSGTVRFMGSELYAEGSQSSRKPFFRVRYEDVVGNDGKAVYDKDGRKVTRRVLLPAEDVDQPNVRKAAYTNFVANAITRTLGLRNLTWDQLGEFGFSRARASSVAFRDRKGAQTAAATASGTPDGSGTKPAKGVPPKGTWLASLEDLISSVTANPEEAAVLLTRVTSFTRKDQTAFEGYASWDALKRSKNLERVSEVAYGKLNDLIKKGVVNPTPGPVQQTELGGVKDSGR